MFINEDESSTKGGVSENSGGRQEERDYNRDHHRDYKSDYGRGYEGDYERGCETCNPREAPDDDEKGKGYT